MQNTKLGFLPDSLFFSLFLRSATCLGEQANAELRQFAIILQNTLGDVVQKGILLCMQGNDRQQDCDCVHGSCLGEEPLKVNSWGTVPHNRQKGTLKAPVGGWDAEQECFSLFQLPMC